MIPTLLDWPRSEGLLDEAGLQLWWFTALLDAGDRRLGAFAMVTAIGPDLVVVTTVLSDRASGTELGARRDYLPRADVVLGKGQVEVTTPGTSFRGSHATGYRLAIDLGEGVGFDLTLAATRPVLFSCATGEFGWNEQGTTKQYALGGLAVRGEARFDGAATPVTGSAWHDRQWWDSTDIGALRFCWFGIWLDNGDTLSVWDRTPSGAGGQAWATVVRPDGTHVTTPLASFALTSSETYPTHLGNTVPRAWDLDLPGIGTTLRIRQETVQDDPGQDFFTGALAVDGSVDGTPLTGQGVCDLAGLRGSWPTGNQQA